MNLFQLLGVPEAGSLNDILGVPKGEDRLSKLLGVTANSTPAGFTTPKTAPSMNFPTSSAQLQPSTKIAQQEASKGFYNNPAQKIFGNALDTQANAYQSSLSKGNTPQQSALQAQTALISDSAMGFTGALKSVGGNVVKKAIKDKLTSINGNLKLKKVTDVSSSIQKAKSSGQSFDDWVKGQKTFYHGTSANLKKFDNKQGTFFTDDYMNADGYAGGENVYEGYINLKKPLVIDAKGALHRQLDTPYGKTTRDIVANVDKEKYDGIIFKNIKDSWIDDADVDTPSTIYYTFKPRDSFINRSQLKAEWYKIK